MHGPSLAIGGGINLKTLKKYLGPLYTAVIDHRLNKLHRQVFIMSCLNQTWLEPAKAGHSLFLARLHEVHRAIAVTPVVHVPVPVPVPVRVPVRVRVRVTLALKFFRSPYLDNHSSESIHTWTIDTL